MVTALARSPAARWQDRRLLDLPHGFENGGYFRLDSPDLEQKLALPLHCGCCLFQEALSLVAVIKTADFVYDALERQALESWRINAGENNSPVTKEWETAKASIGRSTFEEIWLDALPHFFI